MYDKDARDASVTPVAGNDHMFLLLEQLLQTAPCKRAVVAVSTSLQDVSFQHFLLPVQKWLPGRGG